MACTAFVRGAVIPQLGQHPGRVFTRYALRLDLLAWLAHFDNEQERMLCFDYAGNWDLFVVLWATCRMADWRATSAKR